MQDFYKILLEKRAKADNGIAPDYDTNSQEVAEAEVASNKSDQRNQLSGLFDNSSQAQKQDTKLVGRLLPDAKSGDSFSSNPMLKVAMNSAFMEGLRQTGVMQSEDPDFLRNAYKGFNDEIDKIGSALVNAVRKASRSQSVKDMLGSAAKKPARSSGKSLVSGKNISINPGGYKFASAR